MERREREGRAEAREGREKGEGGGRRRGGRVGDCITDIFEALNIKHLWMETLG